MNKLIIGIAVSSLSFLVASGAHAQEVPPKVKELQQALVGSWKGNGELIMPDGKKAPLAMTYDCKSTSAGFGVTCSLKGKMADGFVYESTDIWGYSAGDGLVHWFTVTNAGETHDHKGSFENGTLTAVFEGPQEGKLYVESVSMTFTGKSVKVASSVVVGGKQGERLEGTMSR